MSPRSIQTIARRYFRREKHKGNSSSYVEEGNKLSICKVEENIQSKYGTHEDHAMYEFQLAFERCAALSLNSFSLPAITLLSEIQKEGASRS